MKLFDNKLAAAVRVALAVGALVASGAVFAQDSGTAGSSEQANPQKAKSLQTVTVTGSRIRSVDVETEQPVFTMSRDDIEKTGLVTVGDILSHMTIQGSPTFNKQSVLLANSEQGGSYIDMRNLGSDRVLVLVNGKRWITGTTGMTDLSTVPSSIIERIEVLKDGASAIYGSDAITGVVNIITRDHYNGAEANAYYGQNQGGDGTTQQYDFTVGSSSEKSSVVFNASYSKQDAMWDKSRRATRFGGGELHPDDGLSPYGPYGKFSSKHSGGILALAPGADATRLDNYHPYEGDASDLYNPNQQMMFRIPSEQKSLYVQGKYNFTDNIALRSTAMYNDRVSTMQVAGYPFATGTTGLTISGDSAYNPIPGDELTFFRRTVEVPRVSRNNNRALHFDVGLEGWFDVGSRNWSWDVGYNYNKSDGTILQTGNVNLLNAAQALGPSFINGEGVAQCGTAADPIELGSNASSGQCLPWNLLAGPGAMTPELQKYLFVTGQTGYGSKNASYTANITGGLFDLPAGEVGFAAGYEHREVSGFNAPDQFSQSGYSTDLASGPTSGKYKTNEFYAEMAIPLLRDVAGARELSLDLAGRYSRYSTFGKTVNGKYGLKWKPIDDLLVRGNYAKAFRSPTIDDLYGGASQTFDYYTDPCDYRFGTNAYGADVHNACVAALTAAGIPNAGQFTQNDATGNPVKKPNEQSITPFVGGSNDRLQPETSTTKTLGLVYSPHYLQGFDVSVDWYKINVKNIISGITSDQVLKYCYQGDSKYCSAFSRDANGQVVNLHHSLTNLGTQVVEGVDVSAHYRLPDFGFGRFLVSMDNSYLSKFNSKASPDVPVSTGASWYSIWRLRSNLSVDWSYGDFGATWGLRYFSSLKEACAYDTECNMPNFVAPDSGPSPSRRVGAIAFNDLQARWQAPWNAKVALGVNNVFNRKSPIMYAGGESGSPPLNPSYDIGRYWYVSYTQKF